MDLNSLAVRLSAVEERLGKIETALGGATEKISLKDKKLSAKEFLISKSVKSEAQKVLALSYFLEHFEQLASFNVQDLESAFRSAREKVPKNLNDAVNKNIAKGFLMEAAEKKDSKKAWNLTASGERHVDSDMA